MRIDEYVIIGLASEAKYGCNDICINLTKSDIKAVSGFNSVRLTLADALLLPLSFLLPAPPQQDEDDEYNEPRQIWYNWTDFYVFNSVLDSRSMY